MNAYREPGGPGTARLTPARVDINIKVARSAYLRVLRRAGERRPLHPRLALAKDFNASAVVGSAASLAQTSNRRTLGSGLTSNMDSH